ncbi:myotubularin-related protein 11-like protein [Leptotrombidium deliense]|uniref:Myotubularin-related protein 11-like protein n=1 Tax=Leptotrombidium deliense TaxID=299467 RepID=A0A443SFX6_9ACAR|nr:myotubularin-related protein 11-like protein [Leptotrombidium deliense]
MDNSNGESSFVALRKFSMSPVRNRDSYHIANKDQVDFGMGRLSFSKPILPPTTTLTFRPNEFILVQPIEGVIRYHLNTNRTKGTVGQLILTCVRLKFITYPQPENGDKTSELESSLQLPPFNNHWQSEEKSENFHEDVDLINMYDIRVEQVQSGSTLLTVYCNDFRCIEYQIRNTELVKSLLENLERLTSEQSSMNVSANNLSSSTHLQGVQEVPCLWYQLSTEYSFRFPQDWSKAESHWLQGKTSLRVTHCNDGFHMCSSLPPSFITLKYYLTDSTLIDVISRQLKNHRVPIVCYCRQMVDAITKKELHGCNMLIRSVTLTETVSNIFIQAISPLRVIDVNALLPSLVTVVTAYTKLREACFLYSSTNHFLCRIGKWLKIVSKVLSVVKDLYKIVQNEASLVIMEDTDRHWNPILSCLIQIMLDPSRRTIKGFESLISKEWIYLCGVSNKPNHILFTLFLDCVWQLKYQNASEFEFTSLYLIHLFDLLFTPEVATKINTIQENENAASGTLRRGDTKNGLTLRQLTVDQMMFIYNPFYVKESSRRLKLRSDILGLELWRPLFLRWHPLTNHIEYYNQFNPAEFIYFNSLLLSLFKYNVKELVTNEEQEHHL